MINTKWSPYRCEKQISIHFDHRGSYFCNGIHSWTHSDFNDIRNDSKYLISQLYPFAHILNRENEIPQAISYFKQWLAMDTSELDENRDISYLKWAYIQTAISYGDDTDWSDARNMLDKITNPGDRKKILKSLTYTNNPNFVERLLTDDLNMEANMRYKTYVLGSLFENTKIYNLGIIYLLKDWEILKDKFSLINRIADMTYGNEALDIIEQFDKSDNDATSYFLKAILGKIKANNKEVEENSQSIIDFLKS